MPQIWISSPSPTGTPPIGQVDMGGTLLNAAGGWSRPPGTTAAVKVVGMVLADFETPPARPPMGIALADVPNAAGNGGTWSFPGGLFGAAAGNHFKLAIWLDVEDCGCYFLASPVVFLAQEVAPAPSGSTQALRYTATNTSPAKGVPVKPSRR